MSELPKGWVTTNFDRVIENISNGIADKQNRESIGIPVSRIETIASETINYSRIGYVANYNVESVKKYLLSKGDILFSHINSPIHLGKTAVFDAKNKLYHGTNLLRIVVDGRAVDVHYFNYFCKYTRTVGAFSLNAQHAVNQSSLNQKKIKSFEIPLAPLAEQKRIVAKLDEVLAQVDTIKARLDRIPAILKRFRQSVLAAAVSGKLTEEWRQKNVESELSSDLLERWLTERKSSFHKEQERLIEESKIKRARKYKEPVKPNTEKTAELFPDTWTTVSVSQFAECLDSMRIPVKKEDRASASGLYPYFGANGLVDKVDEYIFDDELVLVTEDETFYGRTKPIAYRSSGKCWVNNHAHVLRASTKAANDYLCYALMYKNVEPWLSGSTGRAKLTQAALNEIPLGLPPEVELEKIVFLVAQYLSFADTIEAQVKKAQARVDNLTQSILAKAFRGELVAQAPNDEPADKLLERIAQARIEAEALAKTSKKVGRKGKATS